MLTFPSTSVGDTASKPNIYSSIVALCTTDTPQVSILAMLIQLTMTTGEVYGKVIIRHAVFS